MNLRVVSIDRDGTVRIAADGPITSDNLDLDAGNPLEALLGVGWPRHKILFDLDKTEHIDSAGIGWLINCRKELDDNGGAMVLHSLQTKVLKILKVLKIETVHTFASDESAARAVMIGEAQ
jgi:anti-anti-sigma factor